MAAASSRATGCQPPRAAFQQEGGAFFRPWRAAALVALTVFVSAAGYPCAVNAAPVKADLALPALDQERPFQLSADGEAASRALAHYTTALQLEGAGRQRDALTHFRDALLADPTQAALADHVASLLYKYEGRDAALAVLNQAIKARPDDPAPAMSLARFQLTYAQDQPAQVAAARAALGELARRFPRQAQVTAFVVGNYLAQNLKDDAIRVIEAAAALNVPAPDHWLALGRAAQQIWPLGQVEMREEHLAKVNPFFEKAVQLSAAGAKGEPVRLEVAQYYLLTNQLEAARALCESIAKASGSLQARKILYRLYDAADEKDLALATLEKIVADAPTDVTQRRLLIDVYQARREFPKAVPHMEAVLQISGGEAQDYLDLGELMLRSQLYEKLATFSARSVKLFPDHPMFHVHAALAERELQHWDKAIASFRAAADLAEAGQAEMIHHRFYFQFGLTLERAARHDEAGKMFEKSIVLTPKDETEDAANTMNYLGYMWLELDRHIEKAGELIKKANELQPDKPAYVDSLGWYYYKKGDYDNAVKELKRAFELIPTLTSDDAEIAEHIGHALLKKNDLPAARGYFEKAKSLGPTDEKVIKRIEEGLRKTAPEAKPQ